jgi:glycosyltransferase involved in cell wall biosynthesis
LFFTFLSNLGFFHVIVQTPTTGYLPAMRILFVSGLTGFASGGVNTEMCRLIGGMRQRGAEVAFAIDRLPPPLEGVRHFQIAYPPDDQVGEKIKSAVADFKPDCVHLIGGGLSVLRPLNSMGLAVPWVFTAHNLPPFEQISKYFLGHNRLHYLVRNARALPTTLLWKRLLRSGTFSKVVAHSQTVAGHLTDYGCPADKVVMIPFGTQAIATEHTSAPSPFPADAYPKILTVAGYAHHKGIHDYIAAVGQLVKTFPRLAYRIIGNSRNQQYTRFLQDRIDHLKIGVNVTLLRSADDAVKQAALTAADLYVQPSHEEGFCLAFAEAIMVVPRLIGCRTGEIAGMAGNSPGVKLVEPKDVGGFVTATQQVLQTTADQIDLPGRAAGLRTRYSWETYLNKHAELFGGDAR